MTRVVNEVFHIRKPDRSELEYLAAMGKEMHSESALSKLDFSLQKTEAWLLSAYKNEQVYFFRVIIDSNEVPIGGMIGHLSKTYYGSDSVANDAILMLQKEYRGKCMPQLAELSKMYKDWATAHGAKIAFLGTTTGIEPEKTEHVFEALGFHKIGTVHAHFVGG